MCKAPLAPRETLVPLVPSGLWATLGPQAWRVLWDRRAQRGPRDPLVPGETLDLQDPLAPRAPLRNCTSCASAGGGVRSQRSQRRRMAAWRRCWRLSRP